MPTPSLPPPPAIPPPAALGAVAPAGPAPGAAPMPGAVPASAWGLLGVLSLIWGTSFILMKKGLLVFSALELGACRVSVAALLLLPFAVGEARRIDPSRVKWLALSGTVGTLIPAFLFAYAETRLASGLAGVLNALTAAFALLMGAWLFGQRLTGARVLGIALGLLGTVVLMLLGGSGEVAGPRGAGNAWYGLYIVAATLGYGLSVNVIKHRLHGLRPVAVTSLLLGIIGGPALAFLLLGTGFVHKLATVPGAWVAFGYIALLATLSTAVATLLFNMLIQQSTTLFASSSTYLIPVVALGWGALDGEAFNAWHGLGMVIILAGVWVIHRAR